MAREDRIHIVPDAMCTPDLCWRKSTNNMNMNQTFNTFLHRIAALLCLMAMTMIASPSKAWAQSDPVADVTIDLTSGTAEITAETYAMLSGLEEYHYETDSDHPEPNSLNLDYDKYADVMLTATTAGEVTTYTARIINNFMRSDINYLLTVPATGGASTIVLFKLTNDIDADQIEYYPVWALDFQFTSKNLVIDENDRPGVFFRASFDPATSTLTLSDYHDAEDNDFFCGKTMIESLIDLTIAGSCHMKYYNRTADEYVIDDYGIENAFRCENLTFAGDFTFVSIGYTISAKNVTLRSGRLAVGSYKGYALYTNNMLTVESGFEKLEMNTVNTFNLLGTLWTKDFTMADNLSIVTPANGVFVPTALSIWDDETFASHVVIATEAAAAEPDTELEARYPVWLGDRQLTPSNLQFGYDSEDNHVRTEYYDPATRTLTLSDLTKIEGTHPWGGPEFTARIYAEAKDLTIKGKYHMSSAESEIGVCMDGNHLLTLNGDFIFLGKGYGICASNIILDWTNPRDRIGVSRYSDDVIITIADGKSLFNGNEFLSSGAVTDLGKVNGKTLVPSSSVVELTITADNATKVYDGTALTKNTYTHTALYEDYYIESVSVTGSQTDAGSCDNVPSGAVIKDATGEDVTPFNFITYVNGTLEVTPKDVTVKADDKMKIIDRTDPTLTATVTGMVEGESENLISYDIGREAGETVGTYVITPTGETVQGNYHVDYETGTLTITDEMFIYIASPTVLNLDEDYISENVLSVTIEDVGVTGQMHSFQWYVNTTDDTTGGTAIKGATSTSYTLPNGMDGLLPGTYYYYCLVTASRSDINKTISKASPMYIVNVAPVDHEPGHYKRPIIITTAAQLNQLAQEVNAGDGKADKYYKLGNDIAYDPDVLDIDNDGNGTAESNYSAIGMFVNNGGEYIYRPFNGHFDGDGHTISGIRLHHNSGVNTDYNNYKGLFGYLGADASISNVTLTDTEITANYFVGGIAGYAWLSSSITNCHVTSSVTIHTVMNYASHHGGIVGTNYGTVSHCTSAVTLTIADGLTPGWNYGGIVGDNPRDGEMTDNLALGVTVPAAHLKSNGAITGNKEGTLSRNYYSGCTVAGETTNVGSAHTIPNVADYVVGDVAENDGAVPVPSATVSKEGFGTYYISTADVVLPAGMKAMIVTGKGDGQALAYETIADGSTSTKTVPAGMAVMLQTDPAADKQTIGMTLAAPTDQRDFTATNLLHGSDVAVETSGGDLYYMLSYGKDGSERASTLGWFWGAAGGAAFTSAAHKAWLALKASAGARSFVLPVGNDNITGIADDKSATHEPGTTNTLEQGAWYSLDGRKLNGRPTEKGVYIHNGRKEVIR